MKHHFLIPVLFIISVALFSFSIQKENVKPVGLYKLVKINDNKLPAHSEEGDERITIAGAVFFSSDGSWTVFSKEKESEDTKTVSYNLLEGTFELRNGTIYLYDKTLDDNYEGKISGKEIQIVSKNDGIENTYLFMQVDMEKL